MKIAQIFKEGLKFGGEGLSGRGMESKNGQDSYELQLHQSRTLEDRLFHCGGIGSKLLGMYVTF